MTSAHNHTFRRLGAHFVRQLSMDDYEVAVEGARLRVSSGRFYVPDVCVLPMELVRRRLANPTVFKVFDEPMPLVVEVWSPSIGDYDVDTKFPEYRRRGDLEIWRLHPYERTLIAWVRQPDGSYTETLYTRGTVRPVALPGVTIDLDTLFD